MIKENQLKALRFGDYLSSKDLSPTLSYFKVLGKNEEGLFCSEALSLDSFFEISECHFVPFKKEFRTERFLGVIRYYDEAVKPFESRIISQLSPGQLEQKMNKAFETYQNFNKALATA